MEYKIKRLADFPEQMLQAMKEKGYTDPAAEPDNNGLRYPIEMLNQLDGSNIMFPLEWMANFADGVMIQNIREIENDFPEQDIEEYKQWNTTSVGNVAYLALHGSTDQIKQHAEKLLNGYLTFMLKLTFEQLENAKADPEIIESIKQFYS